MDWAWSLVEAFDGRFAPTLALLMVIVGGLITMVYLAILFREFQYHRVAAPVRVTQDQTRETT